MDIGMTSPLAKRKMPAGCTSNTKLPLMIEKYTLNRFTLVIMFNKTKKWKSFG